MTKQEFTTQSKQEVQAKEHTRPGRTYVPNADISEAEGALWLRVDMPGVIEDSVEIIMEKNVLSIKGHVALQDYEDLAPVYTEYNVGNYQGRFTLQDAVDAEKIHARLNSGVLELELPLAESAKPRRVAIEVN